MPKIIVQANRSNGDAGRVTFSERVVHLQDDHYAAQLIERLTWAAIDAERVESPTDGEQADEHRGRRPAQPPGDTVSSRPHTPPGRPHAPRADVTTKRPYAWSYDALRPTGELLAARLTTRAVLRPGRRVGRSSG